MAEATYAVIAYLPRSLGRLVDDLRRRFNPDYAAWLAHVTLLPPRPLAAPPEEIVEGLRAHCAHREPFDATIGGVATFWPANAVVYLSFSTGFEQLLELHHLLNVGGLAFRELYDYVPHVTIAQELADEMAVQQVLARVSREWSEFAGDATFRIESLFLVEQTQANRWRNLAPIPLSSFFYAARRL